MIAAASRCVLFAQAESSATGGQWRFLIATPEGERRLMASDVEPGISGERLELLSVVRGLEALDQPSHVTLVTPSRYVSQGLAHGLEEWRDNDWCWERFGELAPINHADLWRRVDRALCFHDVECRIWRFDGPHAPTRPVSPPEPKSQRIQPRRASVARNVRTARAGRPAHAAAGRGWFAEKADTWRQRLAGCMAGG